MIKYILLITCISLFSGCGRSGNYYIIPQKSQTKQKSWAKTYGGVGSDYGFSIEQTKDGGYITAGSIAVGTGTAALYVLKLDDNGNKQWDKTFGGDNTAVAYSIQQTKDNSYIIAGASGSFSPFNFESWILKLDSDGNKIWDKTFGTGSTEIAFSICEANDGGYIYAGAKPPFIIVRKLDINGNEEWNKTTWLGDGYSIQQTNDGEYIVGGIIYSSTIDFYAIKIDSFGNEIWSKSYSGVGWDEGHCIRQTKDGGYIFAGWSTSSTTSESNIWILKLDSNGNKIWDKTYGGSDGETTISIEQTEDGGYIIPGTYNFFGSEKSDFWIIKIDEYGNKVWEKTYGGSENETVYSIKQTSDGGYIAIGDTYSFGNNGDIWVLKLDSKGNCTGEGCPK